MLELGKSWISCGVEQGPDRLLSQTRLWPDLARGLFRGGAPLGWFSAEHLWQSPAFWYPEG